MNLKHFLKIQLLSIALLLTACSTLPTFSPQQLHYLSMTQRHQQLAKLTHWNLTGDAVIKYNGKTALANLSWHYSKQQFNGIVSAPLNLASIHLVGTNKFVTITNNRGQKTTTQNPTAIMQQQFGWSLPVQDLNYWVKGLPTPQQKYKAKYDTTNHLRKLTQASWSIYYPAYTIVNNIDLPQTIILTQNKQQPTAPSRTGTHKGHPYNPSSRGLTAGSSKNKIWIKLVITKWVL